MLQGAQHSLVLVLHQIRVKVLTNILFPMQLLQVQRLVIVLPEIQVHYIHTFALYQRQVHKIRVLTVEFLVDLRPKYRPLDKQPKKILFPY